jgi:hypothetical protein
MSRILTLVLLLLVHVTWVPGLTVSGFGTNPLSVTEIAANALGVQPGPGVPVVVTFGVPVV